MAVRHFGRIIAVTLSGASVLALAFGATFALHSNIFLVKTVEVAEQSERAPVNPDEILRLAAVPVGKANLYELDLAAVENRLLANPWIQEARLQKKFPQTLSIAVIYRKPRALFQTARGEVHYVDSEGKIFGHVNLMLGSDLPLLQGFTNEVPKRILEAVDLIRIWDASPLATICRLSTLSWDAERGLRALVAYPLVASSGWGRTMVDLGPDPREDWEEIASRLSRVLGYLSANSITVRQIWADAGKKIVVKTARGS